MPIKRTNLGQICEPSAFLWATGIEDTFITDPWPATGRTLDEYELTGHYERCEEDFRLMAELGVKTVRYGIPWHRIQPKPGKWDWSFPDRALEGLLELEIDPIVDLVHYGLPPWMSDAFLNPVFPERMAEYAGRVAERYKGRIHCYTPLNEPRVTAWYSGKLGWWPPKKRGWRGFVTVMLAICRGIVRTVETLRAIDPEIVIVHVDATDLYESSDPSLSGEVERRQNIVLLALDLISGRVDTDHPLREWILHQGASEQTLVWFQEHAVDLPLIGINLYPLFSQKILARSSYGLRTRMPYASSEIIDRLADMYWERYQAPLFISETASLGSVKRRRAWLESSVEAVKRVRQKGVPLVGYTWWPLFALVTWAYRQGHHPPAYYMKQMGLWDLDAQLRRIPKPLVEEYRQLVLRKEQAVGCLKMEDAEERRL
ncbi:MAG: glycosyl hydrolase family protein [Verrucomicrobiales bacterium]|nr:glycosyl hydrolase family protein [Verrucomicrobiales bacterium]